MMMNNICVIEELSKSYEVDQMDHQVLKGVNLQLDTQKITVILGKSGCGKTTLLRLLADLEQPTGGKIGYYGVSGEEIVPKIGVVFQESRLMPWLTVEDNILFHQKKKDKTLGEELISLVGLDGFTNAYPSELSGGMAHRVAIARALAFQPDLLLMDEPFAALDYFTRMSMQNEVIKIHQATQRGVVFVTHNVDEALILAHKIVILKKGEAPIVYHIEGEHPRDVSKSYYLELKKEILEILGT